MPQRRCLHGRTGPRCRTVRRPGSAVCPSSRERPSSGRTGGNCAVKGLNSAGPVRRAGTDGGGIGDGQLDQQGLVGRQHAGSWIGVLRAGIPPCHPGVLGGPQRRPVGAVPGRRLPELARSRGRGGQLGSSQTNRWTLPSVWAQLADRPAVGDACGGVFRATGAEHQGGGDGGDGPHMCCLPAATVTVEA